MLHNIFVQCDMCNTCIDLKFQMETFSMPFDIACPVCKTHINGKLCINENEMDKLVLNNAKRNDDAKPKYYVEISPSFPSLKVANLIGTDGVFSIGTTPFMRAISTYGFEYETYIQELNTLITKRNKEWVTMLREYNYILNNRLVSTNIDIYGKEIMNKYGYQKEPYKMFTVVLDENIKININQKIKEITALNDSYYQFKEIFDLDFYYSSTKRLLLILNKWLLNIEKYMPIIILEKFKKLQSLDKRIYGITTSNFDDFKYMYSESYELLLDMIHILIYLNNIYHRGDINQFSKTDMNLTKYKKLVKSSKIDYLNSTEYFSQPIEIDKKARNAIAHFNYEYDENTQLISFKDNYKGKEIIVKKYLIEFAELCCKNINILLYINELHQKIAEIAIKNIKNS